MLDSEDIEYFTHTIQAFIIHIKVAVLQMLKKKNEKKS